MINIKLIFNKYILHQKSNILLNAQKLIFLLKEWNAIILQ